MKGVFELHEEGDCFKVKKKKKKKKIIFRLSLVPLYLYIYLESFFEWIYLCLRGFSCSWSKSIVRKSCCFHGDRQTSNLGSCPPQFPSPDQSIEIWSFAPRGMQIAGFKVIEESPKSGDIENHEKRSFFNSKLNPSYGATSALSLTGKKK